MGKNNWLAWEAMALIVVVLPSAVLIGVPKFGNQFFDPKDAITIRMSIVESGGFDPAVVHVEEGAKVKLLLRAMDMTHGFQISGYMDKPLLVRTGKFVEYEFTADKAGEFPFVCTVYCSPNHYKMSGKLVVGKGGPSSNVSGIPLKARIAESGGFEPKTISVKAGENVTLVVSSEDGVHGFTIEGLVPDTGPIVKGSPKVVQFTAPSAGKYPFKCTIVCSAKHSEMAGELVVE